MAKKLKKPGDLSVIAFAIVVALVFAGRLSAGVLNVYGSAVPTIDLPGYTTYTLSVETDVADIQGFDFLGGEIGDFGFSGAMHQVNPGGMTTVFGGQNGAVLPNGYNPAHDSHFLFSASDLLSIRPSESSDGLRGALSAFRPIGRSFDFAQIVVPDGGQVSFRGMVGYSHVQTRSTEHEIEGFVGEGLLFSKQIDPRQSEPVVPPVLPPVVPLPSTTVTAVDPPATSLMERVGKVSISGSAAATPGLTGYTTYTLSMQTDVADVGGLDFLGGPAVGDFGFFGPMHQIKPSDMNAVFSDHIELIGALGQNPGQDSHFLFRSSEILSIRPSESEGSLHAAFAGLESFGTEFDFAQIVVPDGQEVSFRGALAFRDPVTGVSEQEFAGVVGDGILFEGDVFRPIPEVVVEPKPPSLPPAPIVNDPLPELEIPPTEADPVDPPPLDPDDPVAENPIVTYPSYPAVDPEWELTLVDPILFPRLTDPIFPSEGVVIDHFQLSQLLANNADGSDSVSDASFLRAGGFVAFDGTSLGYGEKSQWHVPEPTALVQSFVFAALLIFRMRASRHLRVT